MNEKWWALGFALVMLPTLWLAEGDSVIIERVGLGCFAVLGLIHWGLERWKSRRTE